MASGETNTPAEVNFSTEDNVAPYPGDGNDFADIAAEFAAEAATVVARHLWGSEQADEDVDNLVSRLPLMMPTVLMLTPTKQTIQDACLAYFLASDEHPSSEYAKYETSKLFAYVMVNAQPFSTPSAEIASKLAKPIKDSFAFRHYTTFYSGRYAESCTEIFALNVTREPVAKLLIKGLAMTKVEAGTSSRPMR